MLLDRLHKRPKKLVLRRAQDAERSPSIPNPAVNEPGGESILLRLEEYEVVDQADCDERADDDQVLGPELQAIVDSITITP